MEKELEQAKEKVRKTLEKVHEELKKSKKLREEVIEIVKVSRGDK